VLILLDFTITGGIVQWEDFLRELCNGCTDKRFQAWKKRSSLTQVQEAPHDTFDRVKSHGA
jgi:hypothetical protein